MQDHETATTATPLVLRQGPNWTFVIVCAVLAGMHVGVSVAVILHERPEGTVGLLLGLGFAGAAALACRSRVVVVMCRQSRQVTHTRRLGPWERSRVAPFASIVTVRLMLFDPTCKPAARIQLLTTGRSIECPVTRYPRQQALLMAMLTGAKLERIVADGVDTSHTPRVQVPRYISRV